MLREQKMKNLSFKARPTPPPWQVQNYDLSLNSEVYSYYIYPINATFFLGNYSLQNNYLQTTQNAQNQQYFRIIPITEHGELFLNYTLSQNLSTNSVQSLDQLQKEYPLVVQNKLIIDLVSNTNELKNIPNDQYNDLSLQSLQSLNNSEQIIEPRNKHLPKQQFGRNIANNIYKVMLNHIKKLRKYEQLARKAIEKHSLSITVKEFRNLLQKKMKRFSSYIGKKEKKKIFFHDSVADYNLLLVLLSRHYLQNDHISHTMNSNKIFKESKPIHLKIIRTLLEEIVNK